MRIIKFTAFAILVCIIFTAFTGCAYFDGLFCKDDAGDATDDNCHENEENEEKNESVIFWQAEIYGYVNDSISSEFAKNNKIKVAYEYDDPEIENAPETLTFIVNDKETFDEIFADAPFEVDFEKETIFLYSVWSVLPASIKYSIDDISVDVKKISIDIHPVTRPDAVYGCQIFQRWIAVKMKKIDVTEVSFT